ncbi:MAG: hypothetical protein AAFX39_12010 [Pseudomonadota bacterium]
MHDDAWHFFKLLHIYTYDFSIDDSTHRRNVLDVLTIVLPERTKHSPQDIWAQLVTTCQQCNQNAATVTAANLAELLPVDLVSAFPFSGTQGRTEIGQLFAEHSAANIRRIRTAFSSGVTLSRHGIVQECIDALSENLLTLIVGEAGGGKSASAKLVLDKLDSSNTPFVIRCEEFDYPSLDAAFSTMGAQPPLRRVVNGFEALHTKVFLVDGAEKLLEMRHPKTLFQFIDLLDQNASWRFMMTCRAHAADIVQTQISVNTARTPMRVLIPRLTDDELDDVAEAQPELANLLRISSVREVLRTPQYLQIAGSLPRDSLKGVEGGSAEHIREALWRAAVRKDSFNVAGLPSRRERSFIELSRQRAIAMTASIGRDCCRDDEATDLLIADGLVDELPGSRIAPAHDLFEDWALRAFVGQTVDRARTEPVASVFEALGTAPAIRRALRFWLKEASSGQERDGVGDFALAVIRADAVLPYWRDDVLIGMLQSIDAPRILSRIQDELFVEDKVLLKRIIHLLRTACKAPNQKILRDAGLPKIVHSQLGMYLSVPEGSGWSAIVTHLNNIKTRLDFTDASLIANLLEDFLK